jgi:CRP-like cAMP-binding protein
VAAYLGLPLFSDDLYSPVDDAELMRIHEAARFLAHSDIGNDLDLAQRTRLAAQCRRHSFSPGAQIVDEDEVGNELYIVQNGTIEVWKDSDEPGEAESRHITTIRPGQIVGEFAVLDQEARSADLIAGPEGTTVLGLTRERILALCEDDAVLGTRLLWNFARAVSSRARLINWQLQRALQRARSIAS